MGTDTQGPSHFFMKLIILKIKKIQLDLDLCNSCVPVNVGINQTQYPIRNNGTGMG
jgi:hypothetical protein